MDRECLVALSRGNRFIGVSARSLSRVPANGISHDEISARYKGFDTPWFPDPDAVPLEGRPLGLEMLDELLSFCGKMSTVCPCDIAYLEDPAAEELPARVGREFHLCGYDFGFYGDQYSKFSVLINEVLFGNCEQMRAYAARLNGNLLLPSLEAARQLDETRRALVTEGGEVEGKLETSSIFGGFGPVGVHLINKP